MGKVLLKFTAEDIVKQLREANALAKNGDTALKTVQSNIAKGASSYEKALLESQQTVKLMESLPKELINVNEYNSLKSYTSSIPKKISELRSLGGKIQDLVSQLGSLTVI